MLKAGADAGEAMEGCGLLTCFDGFQRKTMSTVAYLVLISLDHDVLSRSSSHKPNVPKLSHLPFCF